MDTASDRRKRPRFALNETVQLTLLGQDGRSAQVRIVDASEFGIRIECQLELHAGALIKVEGQDSLLLGEVLYCLPAEEVTGLYFLGIRLTRALFGLTELRRLNQSLLAEQPERTADIRLA